MSSSIPTSNCENMFYQVVFQIAFLTSDLIFLAKRRTFEYSKTSNLIADI